MKPILPRRKVAPAPKIGRRADQDPLTAPITAIFGRELRRIRTEAGVSQERLAHQASMDRTFVSQIERGIRQPTITKLWRLSRALGVEITTLVECLESFDPR
ncbi:MAG: helix-turn-helix transcriptional regulator [Gammaproteobacteria bacterium]